MIINTILSIIRWLNKLLFNIRTIISSLVTLLVLYLLYKVYSLWILDKIFDLLNTL